MTSLAPMLRWRPAVSPAALAWSAAVAAAAAAGLVASPATILAAAAGVVVVAGAWLALERAIARPVLALGTLLGLAVLAPVEVRLGPGPVSLAFPLAAALCAAALLAWLGARERGSATRGALPVMVFMAVSIVSFAVGQYSWFPVSPAPLSAQAAGLALFLVSGGVALAVAGSVRSVEQVQRVTWIFVGAGAVSLLLVVWPGPWPGSKLARLTVPESIGSAFWTWFVAVTASQALANRDLRPAARAGLLVLTSLALYRGLALAASWASGWLPPVVALAVVLLLCRPRVALAVGLVAAAPLVFVAGSVAERVMQQEAYSLVTRLDALRVMLQVMERNPLLGYGPANYYHYTALFPIMGWYVKFNSHNQYLDLLAQTGIVGLSAFGWVAAAAIAAAWRVRTRASRGFAPALANGAIAGIVASLVAGALADWLVPFVYNVGLRGFRSSVIFWFFIGTVFALDRLLARPGVAARGLP